MHCLKKQMYCIISMIHTTPFSVYKVNLGVLNCILDDILGPDGISVDFILLWMAIVMIRAIPVPSTMLLIPNLWQTCLKFFHEKYAFDYILIVFKWPWSGPRRYKGHQNFREPFLAQFGPERCIML